MTDLHRRLMALVHELRQRGDEDLAAWVARAMAREEERGRRRRGSRQKRRRRVRVVTAGGREVTAWIRSDRLRGEETER